MKKMPKLQSKEMLLAVVVTIIFGFQKLCLANPIANNDTLIFSHVIFRHGDRTPSGLGNFPSNPNPTEWAEGLGHLTEIGEEQHRQLGKWLASRYKNRLVSDVYDPSEIYVQSSNMSRTIKSAKANLKGFYDNETLDIPIVSIPNVNDDYLIGPTPLNCPKYSKSFDEYKNSTEYLQLQEELEPFYQNLTNFAGYNVHSPNKIIQVHDIILVKNIHNKSLDEWTYQYHPNNELFNNLTVKSFEVASATPDMTRLSGGYLLKDILDRVTQKISEQLTPNRNLYIYSSHDTTLVRLLRTLNAYDHKFVEYAACLLFEVHLYDNVPHLEIYYRNPTEVVQLDIPNCGLSCALDTMYQLYADLLPQNDRSVECSL